MASHFQNDSNVAEEIHRSYRAWKSWSTESFGKCDAADARYFEAEMAKSGIDIKCVKSVLEVGFGNGEFAAWARSHSLNYIGTERDDELVNLACAQGFEAHAGSLNLTEIAAGRRVDFIVAFDVLEHLSVEEIVLLLRTASACLHDTGLFVARFPSGDSPFSGAIQYGDLTHKAIIGSGMVHQLAQSAGLHVVQIRPPVLPLLGVGLRRFCRRAPIVAAQLLVGWVINLLFHDDRSKVVTSNMLVVFRKPVAVADQLDSAPPV